MYLFNLLDLLVKTTNHVISGIWHFLNFHEVDQWINFAGQN